MLTGGIHIIIRYKEEILKGHSAVAEAVLAEVRFVFYELVLQCFFTVYQFYVITSILHITPHVLTVPFYFYFSVDPWPGVVVYAAE